MKKLKVTVGLFDEEDAADITVDGRVVGRLEHEPCERFATGTRTLVVGRYRLVLTDAAAHAQLYRRKCGVKPPAEHRGKKTASQHEDLIAQREWTTLGVLALEAAERAREADDPQAESYYLALARKCDACADQCTSSKARPRDVGTLSRSSNTSHLRGTTPTLKGDDR